MKKNNQLGDCKMEEFTSEDASRYYIFLIEICESKIWFQNLAYDRFKKIQFMLIQILNRHFDSKILNKELMNELDISLYARF